MDYSMIAHKHAKRAETEAAPPGPHHGHHRGFGPCMDDYMNGLDRFSRVHRLNNIELRRTRSLRFNFRDYRNDYDDYYYMHGPPSAPRELPPGPPPPPPRPPPPCGCPGCRAPPPPPPGPPPMCDCPGCRATMPPPADNYYPAELPYGPPAAAAGYPPFNFFSDENPNGCSVM